MGAIAVTQTSLAGAVLLTPQRFSDNRGEFSETYNVESFARAGIETLFVQDNHSRSALAGTVRGLHCQMAPKAQAKLVRVLRGAIYDVIVDARRGSAQFGQWYGVELSADGGQQLLIPVGFLHGFVTRTDNAEVGYKCSATYSPTLERSVRFDDPDLGIDWGILPGDAILSTKDTAAASWRELLEELP